MKIKGAEEDVEENTGPEEGQRQLLPEGFLQSLLMIRSQEELLPTTMLKVRHADPLSHLEMDLRSNEIGAELNHDRVEGFGALASKA